jgi:hypothetical protein
MVTECDGCGGACCREMNSPPFDGGLDPFFLALPPGARADYEAGMAKRKAEGCPGPEPCFWLTPEGRCRYYDHRPRICREVLMGGDACRNWIVRRRDQPCMICGEIHSIIHVLKLDADPFRVQIQVGTWQLNAATLTSLVVQAGGLMAELQCARRQLAAKPNPPHAGG